MESVDPSIINDDKDRHWFLFYVKAKHERKVEALLKRDGYQSYLPMITVERQWSQRIKKIEEPLFKSYIFVKIKESDIYNVLQTQSIVCNIKFSGKPATIRQRHIDLIEKLILNRTKFELSKQDVKIGELIEIKSGLFKGEKGVVRQIKGNKKLLLSIENTGFLLEVNL